MAEAKVGAIAVKRGADCLVIDAEGDYEGKYAAADRYIRALRARIGDAYPALAGGLPLRRLPPVLPLLGLPRAGRRHLQPAADVLEGDRNLGARGLRAHLPLQPPLGRPIYPLGQTYGGAGRKPIQRFRRFAVSYGNLAPSWWDWQETTTAGWQAVGADIVNPVFGYRPVTSHPLLKRGSKGDLVVWAQEHLRSAGEQVPVTGIFGQVTRAAVRDFQQQAGLTVDGAIGTATWEALLRYEPVRWLWSGRRTKRNRAGATVSRAIPPSRPLSASLPAKGYEIDPGPTP